MRVFVTGATGYLGGRTARALLEAGHEVVALARDRERAASLVGCGARVVEGDLLAPQDWADHLEGMDGLVHAAAMVESWGPHAERFDRVNVTGTLDLLDRAKAVGIDRVVVVSSLFALGASPDGSPRDESALDEEPGALSLSNDYVRTKTEASRRVRQRQLRGGAAMMVFPTVLLGAGAFTSGNHTAGVLADIARGRLPGLVGDGRQVWNLVPVDHAATGIVAVLERGRTGENYILGGEDWTQARLVEEASRLFGVKPVLRRLGRSLPLAVGALCEAWAAVTGRPPLLTRGEVKLYDAHWAFDSGKAQRELGYDPGSVQETLEATVAWLRDEILPKR